MPLVGGLVLLLSLCAYAQTGRVSGTITDPSGAPIPNASVEMLAQGGASALYSTTTNDSGLYAFATVRPQTYDVRVSAPGFARYSARQLQVSADRESTLNARLEIATAEQIVEVSAEAQTVQLASAELANTVSRQQIEFLPTINRQVSTLFTTQAGVNNGRGPTVINGLRTSAASVTLDGVNVQDNFIRTNSLDFMPFRPTIDQIAEMTIAVGNATSAAGGGAAQISIITRSGSNDYHGSLYWYNQNSKFSANEFFNNRSGVAKPFLNLNQPGASFHGRIIRDKLFFFGNWEEYKLKQQASQLRTVLTPNARNGIFSWNRGAASANLLQLRQISIDPAMNQRLQEIPLPNSTDTGDGINTSGYRFNARDNSDRRQFVTRWDYYVNSSNNITGSFNYTKEYNDRADITSRFYTAVPPNSNAGTSYFSALAWRSNLSPTLTNELRGGFALSPAAFLRADANPAVNVTGTIWTDPVNDFLPQGRQTDTYSIQDNANWLRGKHDISFGFQSQFIRTDPYNDGGIVPVYSLGISAANRTGFAAADLAGISSADLNLANSLYSTLGGITSAVSQTFNVRSADSGFVNGATNQRFFAYDTYAGYIQDRWKVSRKLTLTLGMRYEFWTRLRERNNLFLVPGLTNGDVVAGLMDPNAVHDFLGRGDRTIYNADRNNFAPNFGFAYDPTGRSKTVIRGGYSISFINDDSITSIRNNINTNPGLSTSASVQNLVGRISSPTPVPVPTFKVPRTTAENFAISPTSAVGRPTPGLRTPYVQQFSFGVQHELAGTIFELRYVGNHGTQLLRAFDYNQVEIVTNGFLDDFRRAQNNLFLPASNGNPAYTGPGSQPLTVFPLLASGGLLTNATVRTRIRQGEPGELAALYFTNGLSGAVRFFRNPAALAANTINNGGDSTYHALQFDVRRRVTRDFNFQANYTYGKVLSNTAGDGQTRFEPYLDFGNGSLERSRPPFDLTHSIKSNGIYSLPYGRGQRWSSSNAVVNHILGGWAVGGVMVWQSGFPFSVNSNRGTLNRAARSTNLNTASTLLNKQQLDSLMGVRFAGDGVFFVAPSAINTDRRAVASDGSAFFSGQAFYHPVAGSVGGLQRRMFSGPWNFNLDMSLQKRFAIRETHTLEFRAEAFNFTNTPGFSIGDQDVNSTNFGRITGVNIGARTVQFGLYYRF